MSIKYTLKHKILAMERVKTIWEGDGARPRELRVAPRIVL